MTLFGESLILMPSAALPEITLPTIVLPLEAELMTMPSLFAIAPVPGAFTPM